MNEVVVIEVIPNVCWSELAIIIISVHSLCNILIQSIIKIAQNCSSMLRSMIEHNNHKTGVAKSEHADDSPESLNWMKKIHIRWPKV